MLKKTKLKERAQKLNKKLIPPVFDLGEEWWKFLVALEELQKPKDLDLFLSHTQVKMSELDLYLPFLKSFGVEVKIVDDQIYPLEEAWSIKIDFSLSEWMAFQEFWKKLNFYKKEKHKGKKQLAIVEDKEAMFYEKIVHHKIEMILLTQEKYLLYKRKSIEHLEENLEKNLLLIEGLSKKIDRFIVQQKPIFLQFFNEKEMSIFPHRLVYLEGVLCVIGEDLHDGSLVFFGLEDIRAVQKSEEDYQKIKFSPVEINEFIAATRLINGKEERIVLKVFNQDEVDLIPKFHYLGNPYVTKNSEGDLIWASTIELCDDLYRWLYSMKDSIEVLDPGHVRKEFALYCEIQKGEQAKKIS